MSFFKRLKDAWNIAGKPKEIKPEIIPTVVVEPVKKKRKTKTERDEENNKKLEKYLGVTSKKKAKDSMEKKQATIAGIPYVSIQDFKIDPENLENGGYFELDWNDIFIARLVKAGYIGANDQEIVDNWFKTIARNILLDSYEQEQAQIPGNGRRKKKNTIDDEL